MIPRLCYLTDGMRGTGGRPLGEAIRRAVDGGVRMVVLRERELPDAQLAALLGELAPLRALGLRLLVSRRLDVAAGYGLDGVHLGADAVPVARARRWLGASALIGYSAHSAEEARAAASAGATYVTASPVYATQSKPGALPRGPEWLERVAKDLAIPVFALGGVTPERVAELLRRGAWGVAAVSAIGAAPDVEKAARAMHAAIEEAAA